MVIRHVAQIRRTFKIDTQQMRAKTLKNLETLFDFATALAKGEFKTQTEKGQTVKVTLKQRQMWMRIAAYIAQIMNSIAGGFDEKEIDVQLDKLEALVNETKAKTKVKESERPVTSTKAASDS